MEIFESFGYSKKRYDSIWALLGSWGAACRGRVEDVHLGFRLPLGLFQTSSRISLGSLVDLYSSSIQAISLGARCVRGSSTSGPEDVAILPVPTSELATGGTSALFVFSP